MATTIESKRLPFVDLAAQYESIEPEIQEALGRQLRSADFILGGEVSLFEEEFAAYCNADYAMGVDSGLSALELSLRALGVSEGDEVITAANTFIASALAISAVGAKPVFVDVDADTYNLSPAAVESAITSRTAAIMPVHLYGQPADMDAINAIAERHGVPVIEDACQAHGALYKGRRTGSLGRAAAFSFYPGKNLGAYGDGGMVVTSDPAIADFVKMARNYGQRAKYYHEIRGFNSRLDTIQAAVLRVKLRSLDRWNAMRQRSAALYCRLLEGAPIVRPVVATGVESVWHLFVVRVKDREGLREYLDQHGVSTGIHYPVPIHLQQAYADHGYRAGDFPVTEEYARHIISLPMYPELPSEKVHYIAELVREFAGNA